MRFLLKMPEIDFTAFWSKIKDIIGNADVGDIIEMLLVSAVLFVAFRFIKGRKAGALIVGIFVCFIVMAIASIFEFNSLLAVFESVLGYGPLVIIILFQQYK